jgi:hypothetical protein
LVLLYCIGWLKTKPRRVRDRKPCNNANEIYSSIKIFYKIIIGTDKLGYKVSPPPSPSFNIC